MYKVSKKLFFILFIINLLSPLLLVGLFFTKNTTNSMHLLAFFATLLGGLLLASAVLFLYQAYKARVFIKKPDGNHNATTSDYVAMGIIGYIVVSVFIKFLG